MVRFCKMMLVVTEKALMYARRHYVLVSPFVP